MFVTLGSAKLICVSEAIWYAEVFKNESLMWRFHYSYKLEGEMRAGATYTIIPDNSRSAKQSGLIFINGNSREICLLAKFVWLQAKGRNVYKTTSAKARRFVGSVRRAILKTSLKAHPVSVSVPTVTNGTSGEIRLKIIFIFFLSNKHAYKHLNVVGVFLHMFQKKFNLIQKLDK